MTIHCMYLERKCEYTKSLTLLLLASRNQIKNDDLTDKDRAIDRKGESERERKSEKKRGIESALQKDLSKTNFWII